MKKRELLQDKFLADLMKSTSLEAPSDDLMKNVMSEVRAMPAYQPRKKPFFLFLKSVLPWILLMGAFIVFYLTYDLPIGNYTPGKADMQSVLLSSITIFFDSFRDLASIRFYSIALAVVVCGGFLFVIERVISSRMSANRHYLI
ncbi:MAG: hypothetical protein HQ542_02240 [Bacteroidia bacterium]|nr:hypothetical protein [Bacteroidia bacterium]